MSGPITETLAARLAVSSTNRRGTIYNVTSKQWIQGQDNLGLRGQLLFKPSDALSITLAGDYSEQDAACCGSVYVRTGTTQRAADRQFAALAAAQGYTVPSTNPYDRLTDLDDLGIAKNSREEKLAARKKKDMTPEELRKHEEMERLYRQHVLKEAPAAPVILPCKRAGRSCVNAW